MIIPNLRSPSHKTGGIVYFARMIDKIRLHAKGELPAEYHANLGKGFDSRCVKFLGVSYPDLAKHTLEGGSDEELLQWCFLNGHKPCEEKIEVWNGFMRKCGWNDELSPTLERRLREGGFENRTDIQTFFDFIDLDEGKDPALPSS